MSDKKEQIKGSVKEKISLMKTPLMAILPGQISFFVLLSVIPLMSLMFILISKLSLNFDIVVNFINTYIPSGIASVLLNIFGQQKVGALDIFFIVMALYLASKATHSIIVASTEIYDGEQKNFIRTRVKAILMLIILIIVVIGVISIITIGSRLVYYLNDISGGSHNYINIIYSLLKWPFAFFAIFFLVKIVYTIAPNVSIPSSSVNKGALLTTMVWFISTFAFSFYVANFANLKRFYGTLSNLILLMMWIYLLCYIFVYGMTINKNKYDEDCKK